MNTAICKLFFIWEGEKNLYEVSGLFRYAVAAFDLSHKHFLVFRAYLCERLPNDSEVKGCFCVKEKE